MAGGTKRRRKSPGAGGSAKAPPKATAATTTTADKINDNDKNDTDEINNTCPLSQIVQQWQTWHAHPSPALAAAVQMVLDGKGLWAAQDANTNTNTNITAKNVTADAVPSHVASSSTATTSTTTATTATATATTTTAAASRSKKRAAAAAPSPVPPLPFSPENNLAHWITLGTHALHRLLHHELSNESCAVLAALSYHMSAVLLSGGTATSSSTTSTSTSTTTATTTQSHAAYIRKLERAVAGPARHLLGRAVLACTAASLRALERIPPTRTVPTPNDANAPEDVTTTTATTTLVAACLALDQLVHLQVSAQVAAQASSATAAATGTKQWHTLWYACRATLQAQFLVVVRKNSALGPACLQLTESEDWSAEQGCLQALLLTGEEAMIAAAAAVENSKRGTSGRKTSRQKSPTAITAAAATTAAATTAATTAAAAPTAATTAAANGMSDHIATAAAAVQTAMNLLVASYPATAMKMDGRVAFKRWTSVATVWLCEGQSTLLAAANRMLEAVDTWAPLLDCSNATTVAAAADATAKKGTNTNKLVCMPGNVVVVALACRLARMVWETGNTCGSRPPTGCLEQYTRAIWPSSVKQPRKKKNSAGVKVVRTDVCDLATIVVYKLIRAHYECLGSNFSVGIHDAKVPLVVNDFEILPGDLSSLPYYPFVHRAIDDLARAASSSVLNLVTLEQSEPNDRIDCAAAAFVFQHAATQDSNLPLDAKLTTFAVTKLLDAFSRLEKDKSEPGGSTSITNLLYDEWVLDEPIPVPQLPELKPAASRKKKKVPCEASAQTVCTFAGVYDRGAKVPIRGAKLGANEIISLFIRAMEVGRARINVTELISRLITVVERCYDTRNLEELSEMAQTIAGSAVDEPAGQAKKRKVENPVRKTKKRRRTGKGSSDTGVEADMSRSVLQQSVSAYRPIKGARAALASNALDVLLPFLVVDASDLAAGDIVHSLRRDLTIDQIERIVDLGGVLDEIIVRTRLNPTGKRSSATPANIFSSGPSFSHCEKRLWTSHMNVCIALGRGQLNYDQRERPILGSLRLDIFKRIPLSFISRTKAEGWPLHIPAAHRVFVASNLASELVLSSDTRADRFIVDGFLSAISRALERPESLVKPSVSDPSSLCIDDEIPLSLSDVRIFLAAVMRLPTSEQVACRSALLGSVEYSLKRLRANKLAFSLLCEKSEIAAFVARVVTLCTHLAIITTCGPKLREELNSLVGKYDFSQLPTYRAASDWYRPEACFMSVYWDWESSELPDVALSVNALPPKSADQLKAILHLSFALGFTTAQVDQCHLLFASWNALGKTGVWAKDSLDVSLPTALPEDIAILILELRSEVCFVHRLIQKNNDGVTRNSSLLRAIESRDEGSASQIWALKGKATLQTMLHKASKLIGMLVQRFVPDDSDLDQDVPVEVFSLFEALAAYISFAIACYSKPKNDFFSLNLSKMEEHTQTRRGRGYSSESELAASEVDSVDSQDVLFDVFERLREVCDTFGAAPAFPDWLDTECRLRSGITDEDAREAALDAQRSLTKLVATASTQAEIAKQRVFRSASISQSAGARRSVLAGKLCCLAHFDTKKSVYFGAGPYTSEDRDLSSDIGNVCGIESSPIKALLDSGASKSRKSANGCWCPNSAQRVLGHFQSLFRNQLISEMDTPELRAAGEWEVLLGSTLTSACLQIPSKDRQSSLEEAYEYVARVERWEGVRNAAVSSLMPTAALLRLGCCGGVGRKAHPLSSSEFLADAFESQCGPLLAIDLLPTEYFSSETTKMSVKETLAVLARLPDDLYAKPVAAHLMAEPASFSALQGMEAIRFVVLTLSELVKVANLTDKSVLGAAPSLLERLTAILDCLGTSGSKDERPSGLLASFGMRGVLSIDTLAERDLDLIDAFTGVESDSSTDVNFSREWSRCSMNNQFISVIISFLWNDCPHVNRSTRSFYARVLSSIVLLEHSLARESQLVQSPSLLPCIVDIFNAVAEDKFQAMVKDEVCRFDSEDGSRGDDMGKDLCLLLALLLMTKGSTFSRSKLVLSTLEASFHEWKFFSFTAREPILYLFFLYGCRMSTLHDIGSSLLADLNQQKHSTTENSIGIQNISAYADFLRQLYPRLVQKSEGSMDLSAPLDAMQTRTPLPLPNSCSFATKSGFNEQHWYNCYTCGLTWDKGCCTICALICHKGHDVSYARYSSFFCDCGAEEGATESNRETCKCASPLSRKEVAKAFARDGGILAKTMNMGDSSLDEMKSRKALSLVLDVKTCAEIASHSSVIKPQQILDKVLRRGKEEAWTRALFESVRQELVIWKSNKRPLIVTETQLVGDETSYYQQSQALATRRGKVALKPLDRDSSLTPLRVSTHGTFKMKLSTDGSVDRMKKAFLARHGISRSVLVADSRGRLVIAEPCSLLFCSGLPMVNMRFVSEQATTLFARSSMCIMGSKTTSFSVVGMKLSSDNESHLVAWGTVEVAVFVLNDIKSKVVSSVSLAAGLSSNETSSNHVVICEWIPGSQTGLVVACDRFIRIFDFNNSEITAAATVSLEFQATVRDIAVVASSVDIDGRRLDTNARSWTLFLLLDNGMLYSVALKRDDTGAIKPSETKLQAGRSISLSTETFTSASHAYSVGKRVHYLKQSRILLYQVCSGSVWAFAVGDEGKLESGFEFLPDFLSSDTLGVDGYGIRGPFDHWTEMGVTRRNKSVLFRVACVGKRSTTEESALLLIEFNELGSFAVKELTQSSSTATESSAEMRPSLEGVAAFTAPYAYDDPLPCDLTAGRKFVERLFLCSMSSNGSLALFGEDIGAPTKAFELKNDRHTVSQADQEYSNAESSRLVSASSLSFPVTSFEKFRNITESDEIVFEGDGFGSEEEIRAKIRGDDDTFLASARQEGSTLIISSKDKPPLSTMHEFELLSQDSKRLMASRQLISALRVLVGSVSTDRIPRRLFIEGRPVQLTPGVKKWYSIQLTAEEVALSTRNGFISLGIDQPYDSYNAAVIDAIEVYTIDGETVGSWLPQRLRSIVSRDLPSLQAYTGSGGDGRTRAPTPDGLHLVLRALASLSELVGFLSPIKAVDKIVLEKLVQESVLSREQTMGDSAQALLFSFEKDDDLRHAFCDGAILLGCSKFLAQANQAFDDIDSMEHQKFDIRWKSLRSPFQDCLRAASHIAKCRQMNYLQAVDTNGETHGSISADASAFIHKCFARSLSDEDTVSDYVELSLLEMAIAITAGPGPNARGRFGTFDALRSLLVSSNQSVVNITCVSITRFCDKHGVASTSGDEEFSLFAAQKMGVFYKCDSCGLFPIKGTRYSLQDEDHPFDLCSECFHLGTDYGSAHAFSRERDVVIKGKTVGGDTKLTCAEMKMLQPETTVLQRQQLFDEFMNLLFIGVVTLLSKELSRSHKAPNSLIELAVSLIRRSDKDGRKADRAKRLTKELVNGLSRALAKATECIESSGHAEDLKGTMCTFLRALTNLPVQDKYVRDYLLGSQRDPEANDEIGKIKPSCLCDVHGTNLVRRQCVAGVHKGRQYYVCGMDRQSRCNYFAWAEQFEAIGEEHIDPEMQFDDAIGEQVWMLLLLPATEGSNPIQAQLSLFLDTFSMRKALIQGQSQSDEGNQRLELKCYDLESARTDLYDGAFCSRERLGVTVTEKVFHNISNRSDGGNSENSTTRDGGDLLLLETSLELLALVGGPMSNSIATWSSLLCGVILSAEKSSKLRSLAKRALMQLCGGQRDRYLALRDHHVFGFQFEKLIRASEGALKACRLLKEKARQCGPKWRSKENLSLNRFTFGELFGTQDLVSEDLAMLELDQAAHKALHELATGAKRRAENWRRFCGLKEIPMSPRENESLPEMFQTPPITCLLWIACTVSIDNLGKVLTLVDLALSPSNAGKVMPDKSLGLSSSDDQIENTVVSEQKEPIDLPGLSYKSPEAMLSFSVEDAHAFVVRFVCNGGTIGIRRVASNVLAKIANHMEPSDVGHLFKSLIAYPLCHTGEVGKNHVEFLALLHSLPKRARRFADTASSAAIVQSYLKQQIVAIRQDRSNGEYVHYETKTKSSIQRKRFDLACCTHCHRVHQASSKRPDKNSISRSASSSRPNTSREPSKTPWLTEQVSPFVRGHLDSNRDSCTSNEFGTFFSLHCRLSVSAVYAEVNEPRGRYVKTIAVYSTPRRVDDPSILKSEDYADKWQLCGTLSLAPGATRATCTFTKPVVAANIKIEYTDFYERSGGSKASDGTLLVHCPRCTRVVTNAHGVCGNCGEVAFQCRKCRHINYDRLDAFLCVECGYCASGSFGFDIMAGASSNAIAITNDQDYERTVQMLSVASQLHDDLRIILREKVYSLSASPPKKKEMQDDGPMRNAALNRAFSSSDLVQPGEKEDVSALKLDKLGEQGSVVRAVARPESTSVGANPGNDRTQSLPCLVRQWRSDSTNPEQRRVARVVGDEDESMDLLQLLDSSGGVPNRLDPNEPLGRLLASAQSRREGPSGTLTAAAMRGVEATTATPVAPTSAAVAKMAKENMELCERLHLLMREAEREAYELNCRVVAWQRLEHDVLGQGLVGPAVFSPCHCSGCSATTLVNLLLVWLRIFQANPEETEITKEFVQMMLEEDAGNGTLTSKSYRDWRRTVLKEIAIHSPKGTTLILQELRLRLTVTRDVNCAEICGKILEHDDTAITKPFLDLAMEVLENSRE